MYIYDWRYVELYEFLVRQRDECYHYFALRFYCKLKPVNMLPAYDLLEVVNEEDSKHRAVVFGRRYPSIDRHIDGQLTRCG